MVSIFGSNSFIRNIQVPSSISMVYYSQDVIRHLLKIISRARLWAVTEVASTSGSQHSVIT